MRYLLNRKDVAPLLSQLKHKYAHVFAPVQEAFGKASRFEELRELHGKELCLDGNTVFSHKQIFLSSHEKLFDFNPKEKGKEILSHLSFEKTLVFGIRPCDLNAIALVDKVWLQFGIPDSFFAHRRKHTFFIALECARHCNDSAFCTSLGTNKPKGQDLLLTPAGENFFVESCSREGAAILKEFSHFFAATKARKPMHKIVCKNSIPKPNAKWAKLLDKEFNNKLWKKESERCLSCGSCTQVCPTCFCYNVEDCFKTFNGREALRFRSWDSCQLPRFTRVAGGHVFRNKRKNRLRQFVYHKFNYYIKNHKVIGCVGCGRCIEACIVGISISDMLNKAAKAKKVAK